MAGLGVSATPTLVVAIVASFFQLVQVDIVDLEALLLAQQHTLIDHLFQEQVVGEEHHIMVVVVVVLVYLDKAEMERQIVPLEVRAVVVVPLAAMDSQLPADNMAEVEREASEQVPTVPEEPEAVVLSASFGQVVHVDSPRPALVTHNFIER